MVDSSAVKTVELKHEIGMTLEASFCGDCGTVLFKKADNAPNMTIVFVGAIDDNGRSINEAPQAESWTKYRVEWAGWVGSGEMKQFEGFP